MTPELSQRLDSILGFIESTLKQTKDFTVDQAPDVIQQILAWNFWSSLAMFSVLAVAALGLLLFHKRLLLWFDEALMDGIECLLVVGIVLIGLSIIIVAINPDVGPFTWIKILIAPKVYLIEYASSLLHK